MIREKILPRNQCPKAIESGGIETAKEEDKGAAKSQRAIGCRARDQPGKINYEGKNDRKDHYHPWRMIGVGVRQKVVSKNAITEIVPNAFERKEYHDGNWDEGGGAKKYRSAAKPLAPRLNHLFAAHQPHRDESGSHDRQ